MEMQPEGPDRIDEDVTIAEPSPLGLVGIGALAMSSLALLADFDAKATLGLAVVGFVVLVAALVRMRRVKQVRLVIDENGLSIDGKQWIGRSLVGVAVLDTSKSGKSRVTIERRYSTILRTMLPAIELEAVDSSLAKRIVRAVASLREDAYQGWAFALRLDLLLWSVLVVTPLSMALWIMSARLRSLPWTGDVWGSVPGLVMAIAAFQKIAAGSDGVWITSLFGKRFIPITDIVDIENAYQALRFQLRSRKRKLKIRIASSNVRVHVIAKVRDALNKRTLRALAPPMPSDLARKGQPAHEWLSSLRGIASSSTAQYRVAATSAADVLRVLMDQNIDPATRAASAVALDALDPAGAGRIRVVASGTANPKLRVALERVADHATDSEIEASLDELSNARAR